MYIMSNIRRGWNWLGLGARSGVGNQHSLPPNHEILSPTEIPSHLTQAWLWKSLADLIKSAVGAFALVGAVQLWVVSHTGPVPGETFVRERRCHRRSLAGSSCRPVQF
jgi:hypothetical protein